MGLGTGRDLRRNPACSRARRSKSCGPRTRCGVPLPLRHQGRRSSHIPGPPQWPIDVARHALLDRDRALLRELRHAHGLGKRRHGRLDRSATSHGWSHPMGSRTRSFPVGTPLCLRGSLSRAVRPRIRSRSSSCRGRARRLVRRSRLVDNRTGTRNRRERCPVSCQGSEAASMDLPDRRVILPGSISADVRGQSDGARHARAARAVTGSLAQPVGERNGE